MQFDKDMIAALQADGEYLKAMTGEDHGPHFPDLANLQVISVTEPKATHRFDCATCRKSIHRGDVHKKWVYKEFGEFKSIRYHLECNP
jgi:hypothetical protein